MDSFNSTGIVGIPCPWHYTKMAFYFLVYAQTSAYIVGIKSHLVYSCLAFISKNQHRQFERFKWRQTHYNLHVHIIRAPYTLVHANIVHLYVSRVRMCSCVCVCVYTYSTYMLLSTEQINTHHMLKSIFCTQTHAHIVTHKQQHSQSQSQ